MTRPAPQRSAVSARLRRRRDGAAVMASLPGSTLAGVEPERRVLARHQRRVGADAQHPAVEAEHEIEDRPWVDAAKEQREHGEEDEQVDEAERPERRRPVPSPAR